MKKFYLKYFILINLTILTFIFVWFSARIHNREFSKDHCCFEEVKRTGVLRLITNQSQGSFHCYEGKPVGFEYDLAMEFAKFLDVELDVITPGWNNMFDYLEDGKGDLIAAGISITPKRLERVNFSIPYMTIRQHIIHHNLTFGPSNIEDLMFRTIHVRRGTSYQSRLEQIRESGIDFTYVLHDNVPTEELIKMVNDREIKFTVADNNIAYLNQRYYPDIKIGIPIQKKESLAWAVRKRDIHMLEAVNKFFLQANETGLLKQIKEKYYPDIEESDPYDLKKFHTRIKTRLPKFKDTIIQEAEKYDLDWKLLAAVMYQESHFNPGAISFTNVRGLMQITSATAEEMGIRNRLNPTQSIRAGIKYLDRMISRFDDIEDRYEQMLFGLASYNVGYGHVRDAMEIAVQQGLDEKQWQNLKTVLPLLSKSKYYKNTQHGYARGWEPVQYIERVLIYYDILKQKEVDTYDKENLN